MNNLAMKMNKKFETAEKINPIIGRTKKAVAKVLFDLILEDGSLLKECSLRTTKGF